MPWPRLLDKGSTDYHRQSVIDRPTQSRYDYLRSRGETNVEWGGRGRASLNLAGNVDFASYDAIFGDGGARDPATGERLVSARRPGLELVTRAPKSVSCLKVLGGEHAENASKILAATWRAEMAYLEECISGRRGRNQERCEVDGLVYAATEHHYNRALDPDGHVHTLVANMARRSDPGEWRALDMKVIYAALQACEMVGRVAGCQEAVRLYGPGCWEYAADSHGEMTEWRLVDIPMAVELAYSKRSAQIDEALTATRKDGKPIRDTPKRRQEMALMTREAKRHLDQRQLVPAWQQEWDGLPERSRFQTLAAFMSRRLSWRQEPTIDNEARDERVGALLTGKSRLTARKTFTNHDIRIAAAPGVYGAGVGELGETVAAVIGSAEAVALRDTGGQSVRSWTTATAVTRELQITALAVEAMQTGAAPGPTASQVAAAIALKEYGIGAPLNQGQRGMVEGVAASGHLLDLVVGLAGVGKTTSIEALAGAFREAGWSVKGCAVAGVAQRNLQREAGVASTTLASLLRSIERGRADLDDHTLLIVDESETVSDADVLPLLRAAKVHGTKVVLVGDDKQLSAVQPGGNLQSLLERFPDAVWTLDVNLRQRPEEAAALAQLRSGDVDVAVDWMIKNERVRPAPTLAEALDLMAGHFADDVAAGKDTAMICSTRATVSELNLRARDELIDRGIVDQAQEVQAPDGTHYAPGDWIVMTAPLHEQTLVNGQRGRVVSTDRTRDGDLSVTAFMEDDREPRTLRGGDIEQLTLGYCMTVHRTIGKTYSDDVHRLEEPGAGREAAYVGVSRSKSATFTYGAWPDGIEQAREELGDNWDRERRPFFVTDRDLFLTSDQQTEVRRIETMRALRSQRQHELERDIDHDLGLEMEL